MERTNSRPIIVTGFGGQLGTELCRQLKSRARPLSERELDLTKPEAVRDCLTRLRPAAIINAAAYTQVDRAEDERVRCFEVNAKVVETLAGICRQLDCPLVQISTDYVFGADTARSNAYSEYDKPSPLGVYGRSKYAGEQAAATWHKHYIVRTCGLYSVCLESPLRGRNFVDTMLDLARTRRSLKIVDDQHCTPSYVPHVAMATLQLMQHAPYGIYHVTNQGSTNWHDFAAELFRRANIPMSLSRIRTVDYGAPAPRPLYSVLDTKHTRSVLGRDLPSWQTGIRDYLARLHPDTLHPLRAA